MIKEEMIIYKGENCLVRLYQNDEKDLIYKCIVGLNPPLIYETETYRISNPTKVIWHTEVLEVDKTYPDELFTIVSKEGMVLQDKRAAKTSN